jgi:hypothetical protein
MKRSKVTNAILEANGGIHSSRAMKKPEYLLNNHGFKRPILVHLVLTGSQCRKVYQSAYRAIAAALRYYGNEVEYFGCFENEDEAGKGMHVHLYLLIETDNQFPWTVLDVRDGKWLHKFTTKRGLKRVHIAPPQNKMHRRADGSTEFFARPVAADGRLADCLQRISYLFKMRSKAGMVSRETYFNSEIAANVATRAKAKAKRTSSKVKPVPPPAVVALPVAPVASPAPSTGLPVAPAALALAGSASKQASTRPGWFNLGKGSEIKVEVGLLRPLNGRIMVATADKHERRTT